LSFPVTVSDGPHGSQPCFVVSRALHSL
jgi:hypothetical protein